MQNSKLLPHYQDSSLVICKSKLPSLSLSMSCILKFIKVYGLLRIPRPFGNGLLSGMRCLPSLWLTTKHSLSRFKEVPKVFNISSIIYSILRESIQYFLKRTKEKSTCLRPSGKSTTLRAEHEAMQVYFNSFKRLSKAKQNVNSPIR